MTPECTTAGPQVLSGKTVRLDYATDKWQYATEIKSSVDQSRSCLFGNVTAASSIGKEAKLLLRALALLPEEEASPEDYEGDYMWWNNAQAERCVFRGGGWNSGAAAGVFYLHGHYARSYVHVGLGFRPAYIPEVIG